MLSDVVPFQNTEKQKTRTFETHQIWFVVLLSQLVQ